jgi:hypothetical protein
MMLWEFSILKSNDRVIFTHQIFMLQIVIADVARNVSLERPVENLPLDVKALAVLLMVCDPFLKVCAVCHTRKHSASRFLSLA